MNWSAVPEDWKGGLALWVEQGTLMGGPLALILRNDLAALAQTLPENRWADVYTTLRFLRSFAPPACWGSVDAWEAWEGLARRGKTPAELTGDAET